MVPSGANHVGPVAAAHGSAPTPISPPPPCATHDAAIHPSKYSTYVEASRPLAGTDTETVACGGTVSVCGLARFLEENDETLATTGASPGFARYSVAFHSFAPPPCGQNHAPELDVAGEAGSGGRGPTPRWSANPPPTTTTSTASERRPCPRPRVPGVTCRCDLIETPASA